MQLRSVGWLLLLSGLLSCNAKQAFNYSEQIVAIEKTLIADAGQSSADILRLAGAEQFDSVAIISERMEALIGSKLRQVEQLEAPDVKEADNFKRAAIKYFAHIKSIYTNYRRVALAPSEEKREIERQHLIDTENEMTTVLEEMKSAQQKFAAANGFRVEKK